MLFNRCLFLEAISGAEKVSHKTWAGTLRLSFRRLGAQLVRSLPGKVGRVGMDSRARRHKGHAQVREGKARYRSSVVVEHGSTFQVAGIITAAFPGLEQLT